MAHFFFYNLDYSKCLLVNVMECCQLNFKTKMLTLLVFINRENTKLFGRKASVLVICKLIINFCQFCYYHNSKPSYIWLLHKTESLDFWKERKKSSDSESLRYLYQQQLLHRIYLCLWAQSCVFVKSQNYSNMHRNISSTLENISNTLQLLFFSYANIWCSSWLYLSTVLTVEPKTSPQSFFTSEMAFLIHLTPALVCVCVCGLCALSGHSFSKRALSH